MQFRLGCAVWSFDPWVGDFYPPGSTQDEYLELYTERLTAVEGNTTFYAVPSEERVADWASKMPDHFRFCPKLHQDVTHDGRLADKKSKTADFLKPMKAFGDHLGPFHLQLPPRYGPEQFDDLAGYLRAWPRDKAPVGVEVRHPDWFEPPHEERFYDLLDELGVGRFVLDSRPVHEGPGDPQKHGDRYKPDVPMHPRRTADFIAIRYISHTEVDYNDRYLEDWAERIDDWLRDGTEVYFFVHCPLEEKSPGIARRFQEMLEEAGAPVPTLPWNELPPIPKQEGLF